MTDYNSSYKTTNKDQDLQINRPKLGIVKATPTFTVAKWQIKHKKQIVSENITSPLSFVSKVKPCTQAKFIDRFSHTYFNEIIQIYSALKRSNLIANVVTVLNKVFPEIKNIDILTYPDGSMSIISILENGNTLPLYACGDGVQRCFFILGTITLYKNSIICIEEIDLDFHPDVQSKFSKNLAQYAQNAMFNYF